MFRRQARLLDLHLLWKDVDTLVLSTPRSFFLTPIVLSHPNLSILTCLRHLWSHSRSTRMRVYATTSKLFKTHTQEHSFAWEQEQNVRWRTPCKYFSYIGISSWLVVFKSTTLRLYVYVYVMCMHLFTLTQTFY